MLVVQVLREFAVEVYFLLQAASRKKEKFKYRRATYKIRRRVFFSPTSRSSQGSEGFFFRRATYKVTYVEAVELRQGWSVTKN